MRDELMKTINDWIDEIQVVILRTQPELAELFETYAAEALFARSVLDRNLRTLPEKSEILEVGAGSLILSCQLVREGYAVTALEPVGQGFSHFNEMQNVILNLARQDGFCPNILQIHAEHLELQNSFDFAFSINVMEHVDNVSQVIRQVVNALKPDAIYRFICPNYSFPYEPHFNIPTIYSKKITETIFKNKIYANSTMSDPAGTWRSINWISVGLVRDIANKSNSQIMFSKRLLLKMIERVVDDPIFSARRPSWLKFIFKLVIKLNLHKLTQYIPVGFQPIMDCSIYSARKM